MKRDDCNEQLLRHEFHYNSRKQTFRFYAPCTYVNMYAEDAVMFMK